MCILQDDEEDWRQEALQMGNVYEKAMLTLAATSAPDSTHGLSQAPMYESHHLQHVEIPFYPVAGAQSDGSFSIAIEWRDIRWKTDPFVQLRAAPLTNRGWVRNERLKVP